jgi:FdhD protein
MTEDRRPMTNPRRSTARRSIQRVSIDGDGASRRVRRDELAAEEPLEIRVMEPGGARHRVAVTMRTPGADFELAAGFLYGEHLIAGREEVASIRYCVERGEGAQQYNVVSVALAPGASFDPASVQRNFYVSSSCGVCGKASIEAALGTACDRVAGDLAVEPAVLLTLPERLGEAQPLFARTGGLHAAGLFDAAGRLLRVREDVGRHNAVDKLVGAALLGGELPLSERILMVSGRVSFELVQKAARAGASLLAGVSAPSGLAVELAEAAGITLVGFLRGSAFNVYSRPERIAAAAGRPR